jgi:hypothetical protein
MWEPEISNVILPSTCSSTYLIKISFSSFGAQTCRQRGGRDLPIRFCCIIIIIIIIIINCNWVVTRRQ